MNQHEKLFKVKYHAKICTQGKVFSEDCYRALCKCHDPKLFILCNAKKKCKFSLSKVVKVILSQQNPSKISVAEAKILLGMLEERTTNRPKSFV